MFFLIIAGGALVAGQVNRAIYRLAWNKRQISPWSAPPQGVKARSWLDCIPVLGWFRLRRESGIHGTGFWVRPALIEIGMPIGFAALYIFELDGGLLPIGHAPVDESVFHSHFVSHTCLIVMMIVASFIDIDEKTIPDEVTLPGTLVGVSLAGLLPTSLLPVWTDLQPPIVVEPLLLTSPSQWLAKLNGWQGLVLGILCVTAWWYALLPKTLWYRRGVFTFVKFLVASVLRNRLTPWISSIAVVAVASTVFCWHRGGLVWQAVLSSWLGVVVGGGAIWTVRVVGSLTLRQEAMGFGDVTLMGMIGAFVGWQTSLLIFFAAPFTGLVIAVGQWLLTRRKDIPYGPFLCLATLLVVLGWPVVWTGWGYPIFVLGWFLPAVLLVSLLL